MMRTPGLSLAALFALGVCGQTPARSAAPAFDGAMWIWFSREPMPSSFSFPGGVCYFRGSLALPDGARVASAELCIAADNLYSLYVNGTPAGEGRTDPNAWNLPKRFDVAGMLVPGRNLIAVEAINTVASPAGLLVKLAVELADSRRAELVTDGSWLSSDQETSGWEQPSFDDKGWRVPEICARFGSPPWGALVPPDACEPAGDPLTDERRQVRRILEDFKETARSGGSVGPRPVLERVAPADYSWPEGLVFVAGDASLYRPAAQSASSHDSLTVTTFNPHHSRAFPEHDLPAPIKVGRTLIALAPARPGVAPRTLLDAGKGAIGAPGVSFDGRWVYFSMVPEGEPFFHIYRVTAAGGPAERLTAGPFHDIDPAELPDGRIVFTSTRIGTFEEYHNPPSRALFTMRPDGGDIRPLTHTFIFDNEPEVLADGRLIFIRSDNFFDRGKVETLLHATHPDGTSGYTEFGLDLGPEYGGRLRAFNVGSPAPMPDGRVAFVTGGSIAVGRPGAPAHELLHIGMEAGDVAALPDGRLLCTLPRRSPVVRTVRGNTQVVQVFSHARIAIVDPRNPAEGAVAVFDSPDGPLHSPVYLGARTRPPAIPSKIDGAAGGTGVLFCQNARHTKNSTAGWSHVRAIRVLAGKGLTVRSSHSYIVHAGSEVIELGTVPLAPDGSFAVEVPADTAIAFQAVDAEGRSELNEMSWIYVRPGEKRGCVGCHQQRQAAPPAFAAVLQAMRVPPLKLLGQGQPLRFRGNNAAVTGLMELQFDRYREVASLNRFAETRDPLATGPREVAACIDRLANGDAELRVAAAQRLAVFRSRAAAPALAACFRAPERELRVAAAVALAACGTRESVEPLLAALRDTDALVAQAAAVALENLTGRAQEFDAFAVSSRRHAQAAAWTEWFRATTWDAIERELAGRIERSDRDDVRRAAVALGHIGGAAACATLRAYVTRESTNNPYPEWRRDHQGDGAQFNSRSPANPRTLQEATRALGHLRDMDAVPLLAQTLVTHADPASGNLFLAECAAEALGRIASLEAEAALVDAFARLQDYPHFTRWYGDHDALIACHASPVHYLITEALDRFGSTQAGRIVPHLIRSVPTDVDRALFLPNDDCETLVGRVIRRSGAEPAVIETCLAILGDACATGTREIEQAIATTHQAWGGKPDPENRAAQIVSLVCRDASYEPRIRAAFERYRDRPNDIPRVFDTGIPVVTALPVKHWVCFFLARALGNLADPRSADTLAAALDRSPTEAAPGRPDPLGPGVLFLHDDLTPCWRAAVAWALGRIGDARTAPVLLKTIADMDNATDTRHAAAEALRRLDSAHVQAEIRALEAEYPEVSTRRVLREILTGARTPLSMR